MRTRNNIPKSRCIGLSNHHPKSTSNGVQQSVNWILMSIGRPCANSEVNRGLFHMANFRFVRLDPTLALPSVTDVLLLPSSVSLGSQQYFNMATKVSTITFTPSAEKETKGSRISPNHLKGIRNQVRWKNLGFVPRTLSGCWLQSGSLPCSRPAAPRHQWSGKQRYGDTMVILTNSAVAPINPTAMTKVKM